MPELRIAFSKEPVEERHMNFWRAIALVLGGSLLFAAIGVSLTTDRRSYRPDSSYRETDKPSPPAKAATPEPAEAK